MQWKNPSQVSYLLDLGKLQQLQSSIDTVLVTCQKYIPKAKFLSSCRWIHWQVCSWARVCVNQTDAAWKILCFLGSQKILKLRQFMTSQRKDNQPTKIKEEEIRSKLWLTAAALQQGLFKWNMDKARQVAPYIVQYICLTLEFAVLDLTKILLVLRTWNCFWDWKLTLPQKLLNTFYMRLCPWIPSTHNTAIKIKGKEKSLYGQFVHCSPNW